jgi:hypothetical protein
MHFLDRIKWLLISRMRECGIPDYKKTKFNKFFQIRNENQPTAAASFVMRSTKISTQLWFEFGRSWTTAWLWLDWSERGVFTVCGCCPACVIGRGPCCCSDEACHLLLHLKNSTRIELPLITTPNPANVARRIERTGCTWTCKWRIL